jgi:hypothetical protein
MIERRLEGRSLAAERLRAVARNPALAAPLAVAILIVVAAVARILMNRHVLAPWAMEDELQYSDLAKSFAADGHYLFRDQPRNVLSVYPALISPAWFAASMQTTYALAKAFNVALMTLAAIPLWFWARRLVSPLNSVLVVILFLAIPSFVYTGEILTENAYLPAVVLALFGLALALERPTIWRQLLMLALAAAAVAVRVQGIVFALIIPTAIVLKVAFDLRAAEPAARRPLLRDAARRWSFSLGALAFVALLYGAYKTIQGASLYSGFGIYSGIAQSNYSVREASRWVVYHFGELAFSVGVLPFSALVVLVGIAFQRRTPAGAAERAFVAAAAAGVFWTVVEAGVFASDFAFRIEERYMFNVVPVLLLALVVWLDRGLPRPPALTAVAALLPAALLLTVPYTGFFTVALYNDTFGLVPLWRLTGRLGNVAETEVLVGLGMLVAGVLFVSVPRRAAVAAVPASVLAFFIVSTNSVFGTVEFLSSATRHAGGLSGDPSWIDHRIGKDARAEFLFTTEIPDPHMLWQSEFWNRSVHRVFGVTAQDPSIPDVTAPLDPKTGRIVPGLPGGSPDLKPKYVVAASSVDVAGERIAQNGLLSLYRVRSPLRLASLTSGVTPDTWTGPSATYTRYVVSNGARHVNVVVDRHGIAGPPPAKVRVAIGPVGATTVWTAETWTLQNGSGHRFTLPVRRAPFTVRLSVTPTFSPSQYGSPDTRVLGVRVSFSVAR